MERPWRPKPGDVIVRHPREEEIRPVLIRGGLRRGPSRTLATPLILVYGFAALIAIGTILLLMPFANTQGGLTPFMDAFFTATSAVLVTGLVVQDSALYWSRAGQGIIMFLIFVLVSW